MQSGRRCGSGVGVGVSNFGALLMIKTRCDCFQASLSYVLLPSSEPVSREIGL